ncbi:PilN domain-containing protein [Patescibacteria group bacterium]|nr:PilN domain-containing protein [Patescibacteria group bacterium]MBU1473120.1 PilN domain-containing protein [Patescibacteria group bacterium]MBU2459656.1 PilN domain-containing protein [Patescibacteria group bacterium]MBU2544441.1 PilN domain-containing protein [Patescibacteria group bacterium]
MPAKKIRINLLGTTDLEFTPWGRIVTWATTYGRYIMILTEVVVLMAFLSRFSLDRKLTDLKEEIEQKQMIIEANLPFEEEIRALQDRLAKLKTLLSEQPQAVDTIDLIRKYLPPDVYLNDFEYNGGKLTIRAVAGTNSGFSRFLYLIQTSKELNDVSLSDIQKKPAEGITFQLTAQVGAGKK